MPNFSANLTMLFKEVDFLDRFDRAAWAGFTAVEYLFPYELSKADIRARLDRRHLEQVLFNLPAGDWAKGERGIACLPGREKEFRDGVSKAIDYAKALNCKRLNCLAGIPATGTAQEVVHRTLVENLRFAARALEDAGISLLLEAINVQDMPGFYVNRTRDALKLFEEVGHKNLWLQYDIYHMQIMEGNLTRTIKDNLPRIAHMQLADNPGRHEPGTGEINYPYLFRAIDEAGYKGWIGCEYNPSAVTEDGLTWLSPYLHKGGN